MSRERQDHRFTATRAARSLIYARIGLCGAGGSGKSYSALAIAAALVVRLRCGPLYVIDSENRSALRYAKSPRTGRGFDFMHVEMPEDDYSPASYMRAIDFCEAQGAGVILIDSISHEYDGPAGILEIVDNNANGRDNFAGWRVATPLHKRFLQRLNSVRAHTIWTVRAKTAYESRKNEQGKIKFEKTGLGPVQREGIEYEPDLFVWMNDAVATVDKTRCDYIDPGSVWPRPGTDFAEALANWIEDVDPEAPRAQAPAVPIPSPADLLREAGERAKRDEASAEDLALLVSSSSPRARADGWACGIRGAPLDTLEAIESNMREREKHPRVLADMLALVAQRRAERTEAEAPA